MKPAKPLNAGSTSALLEQPEVPVARVEVDRFCEHCGYNLHSLPVYRDARTGIFVVRCPECGRFQPANDTAAALRPGLRRATALVLWIWFLAVVSAFGLLCLSEFAVSYGTLEELTTYGGAQVTRINNTTIRTWTGAVGRLEINTDLPYQALFVTIMLVLSATVAFTCGLFAVVVLPHWRRAASVLLVLGSVVLVGGLVAVTWSQEAPHLFTWGLHYVAAHTAAQLLGGMAGVACGRPLARLAVRIVLPPNVRPRLGYLWSADGKPLPRP